MSTPRAVLFDVDGTLVDTTYLHTVTWWEALRQQGHHVDMADVHRAIGMGGDKILDHLLPDDRDRDGDAAVQAAHSTLYGPYWPRLRAFDGAAELLRTCAGAGRRVVLASSAGAPEMQALRAALDADDAITDVTSADDAEQSKPAPDLVQTALERAGVTASEAVFVGDAVWDVQACRAAGVPCIGLLCGGAGADELRDAGAVEIWRGPAELLHSFSASALSGAN